MLDFINTPIHMCLGVRYLMHFQNNVLFLILFLIAG